MPNFSKLAKGLSSVVRGTQEALPFAEREANKAKFLEKSKDPNLFYHATSANIPSFIPHRKGTFVTPSTKFANEFVDTTKSGANIMPVRVQVTNPFDYDNPEHMKALREMALSDPQLSDYTRKWLSAEIDAINDIEAMSASNNNWASIEHPAIQKLIKDMGHDSYYTSEFGTKNLSVYDPRKIKSDIGNKGTYDVSKPDINEAKGGGIHMQSGGALKAIQAIKKAARTAGQEAPVLANKDLTTVQDLHTSLGDAVRARAIEAQKMMDSWNYKYQPGQYVFTEDSASRNMPPMRILERARAGYGIVREDMNNPLSKKIIDPETGKTKRTPYEPGYRVRMERSPDDWSEFLIPESAIKGDVEMAKGGSSKKKGGDNSPLTPEEIARGNESYHNMMRKDVEEKLEAERNKEAFNQFKSKNLIPETYHQQEVTEPNYTGMIAQGLEGEDIEKARELYNLGEFLKNNPQYQAPSYDDNSLLERNPNIYHPATRIHPMDVPYGIPLQEGQGQIYPKSRAMPSQMDRAPYYRAGGEVNMQSGHMSLLDHIRHTMDDPSALRLAVGGGVTNMSDTRPDTTDGGATIPAPFFAEGGEAKMENGGAAFGVYPSAGKREHKSKAGENLVTEYLLPQDMLDVAMMALPYGKVGRMIAAGAAASNPMESQAGKVRTGMETAKNILEEGLKRFKTTKPETIRRETETGGYSVSPASGVVPKEGLMMGKYANTDPRNTVIEANKKLTRKDIEEFYKKNKTAFENPNVHLGTWKDPDTGKVYLDVSNRFAPDEIRKATKFGERTNQIAGYNVGTGQSFPVGNWRNFIASPEFHERMNQMNTVGRNYLAQHPTVEWWDMPNTIFETVYGQKNLPHVAGYTATTAPNTAPRENLQTMSEYMRRHIRGEPTIQPNYRVPAGMMTRQAGTKLGMEAGREANLMKSRRGALSDLQQNKVREEASAMMGDPNAVVLDRHWARLAEDPARGIFTATQEGVVPPNLPYEQYKGQVVDFSKNIGRDPRNASADIWTGTRETIRNTNQLFGQPMKGSALTNESKSYADHLKDLIEEKARHLGITPENMMDLLSRGEANLLRKGGLAQLAGQH